MNLRRVLVLAFGAACLALLAATRVSAFSVASTEPARHAVAPAGTAVQVHFELPVSASSVTPSSFRVFGKWSGAKAGIYALSNGNRTVTFTPSAPFAAGEIVSVQLSNTIVAADATPFRPQGFAFQFLTAAGPAAKEFVEIDRMSNRIDGQQTRIYGACAADLNADGHADLTTINEVSGDVRVFLNRADGSGLFHDFLPPQDIGQYASPNEPADFNQDGQTDLCVAATGNDSVWVLLGNGDGSFHTITPFRSGGGLHGVVTLDADGDGDTDIVAANMLDNNCTLLINDGTGTFSAPVAFEGGVNGEDGLATGDMDGDGISDVLVAGRWSETIVVHRGNGDGTFTPAGPAQDSGGETWVLALGDLDGDGNLDVTAANNFSNNGAALLGNGDGTLDPPVEIPTGARVTSTDLGDLDGDGDLDWVLSSFGGAWWRIFENDGSAGFILFREIAAPANPSCAVLVDTDGDQDLDLCLTDEIADLVVLMENTGDPTDIDPAPRRETGWSRNVPNPFVGRTTIRFYMPLSGDTGLEIYDANGRRVHTARREGLAAGENEFSWEALGTDGRPLAPGTYFYRILCRDWLVTERMTLLP